MTDGILSTVKEWTGIETRGCPWRAFFDPFTQRVVSAYRAYDKGQLASIEPSPSHRLIEGVLHYARTANAIEYKFMELDREAMRQRATSRVGS